MAEWAGVVATTTSHYFKGAIEMIMRNRRLLAILQNRGRVTLNQDGKDFTWVVRYKQVPLVGYSDMQTSSFQRENRFKNPLLDWRGYRATDIMSGKEREMNKGAPALVKRYATVADTMRQDVEAQIGQDLYIDGNASGNQDRWHGLESFFGNGGAYAGGFIGSPSDTYAGLSTVLGNYGGAWSGTTWPAGTGDSEYDFWSPLIVDYTDTAWNAGTKTWINTCEEAVGFGLLYGQKNSSLKEDQIDLVMLDASLYRQFKERMRLRENIMVTPTDGSSGLYKLGFTNVIVWDGVDISWEYGVPANVGYGLAMNKVELMCLLSELFQSKGPEYSIDDDCYRFALQTFSNLKFEGVRQFVKWMSIT